MSPGTTGTTCIMTTAWPSTSRGCRTIGAAVSAPGGSTPPATPNQSTPSATWTTRRSPKSPGSASTSATYSPCRRPGSNGSARRKYLPPRRQGHKPAVHRISQRRRQPVGTAQRIRPHRPRRQHRTQEPPRGPLPGLHPPVRRPAATRPPHRTDRKLVERQAHDHQLDLHHMPGAGLRWLGPGAAILAS